MVARYEPWKFSSVSPDFYRKIYSRQTASPQWRFCSKQKSKPQSWSIYRANICIYWQQSKNPAAYLLLHRALCFAPLSSTENHPNQDNRLQVFASSAALTFVCSMYYRALWVCLLKLNRVLYEVFVSRSSAWICVRNFTSFVVLLVIGSSCQILNIVCSTTTKITISFTMARLSIGPWRDTKVYFSEGRSKHRVQKRIQNWKLLLMSL